MMLYPRKFYISRSSRHPIPAMWSSQLGAVMQIGRPHHLLVNMIVKGAFETVRIDKNTAVAWSLIRIRNCRVTDIFSVKSLDLAMMS